MKNSKAKQKQSKSISKLDKFEILSFDSSSKITGGGTCTKSGGGDTSFPTAPAA